MSRLRQIRAWSNLPEEEQTWYMSVVDYLITIVCILLTTLPPIMVNFLDGKEKQEVGDSKEDLVGKKRKR